MSRRMIASLAVLALLLLAVVVLQPWTHFRRPSDGPALDQSARSGTGSAPDGRFGTMSSGASAGAPASRGTVVDAATGSPVGNATLVVRHGSPREEGAILAETQTTADGRFELPCGDGRFVEARAKGYVRTPSRLECREGWTIALSPGIRVEGVVLRLRTKEPLRAARVYCTHRQLIRPFDEVETTADGSFSLTSCTEGEVAIVVSHPEAAPASKELGRLTAGAGVTGVVVELADGRTLTGRVVDAAGAPVPMADVVALDGGQWDHAQSVKTDEKGAFEIGTGRGEQVIGAFVADGRATRARVAAGAEPPTPIDLVLPAWGSMNGRLTGADLAGVHVVARRREKLADPTDAVAIREHFWLRTGRSGFVRSARVDGDRFVVDQVEPGSYYVAASTATARGDGTYAHDDPAIVVTLQESSRLAFTITWEDGTPADGHVLLDREDSYGIVVIRNGKGTSYGTNETGEVTATFFPSDAAHPAPAPTVLELRPGETGVPWTLSRSFVRVDGRVVGPGDAPLAGARVSMAVGQSGEWAADEDRRQITGEDGRFSITVSSIDVHLFVQREGFASEAIPARDAALVRLEPGESADTVAQKPAHGAKPSRKAGPLSRR